MSQPSVKSSESLSPTPLNPVLQGVLSHLDIDLEAELSQYRRHSRREASASHRPLADKQAHKPLELIAMGAGASSSPATVLQTTSESNPLGLSPATPGPLIPTGNGSVPPATESVTLPSETLPVSTRDPLLPVAITPDHYLQSSEALLKSLDEEQSTEPERSWTDYLLTPLGIGSMLLFLLSCATLGYVVTNTQDPLIARNQVPAPVTPVTSPGELPKAPNLVAQEFVQIDLDTLSKINPQPSTIPVPRASLQPTLPAQPQTLIPPAVSTQPQAHGLNNLADTLIPKPSPRPPATVIQANPVAPSPPPAPASPPSPTTPVASEDGFYYVVINYTGAESLTQAQEMVPDAYIRETSSGAKISMGALGDAASAARLAEELKGAGFNPQYHKF